jgi:hypothetical protein
MYSMSNTQHDRVYQISGKLSSILNNLESDKGQYLETIEKRILSLETNISESLEQENKKFQILSERVENLQGKVEDLKASREEFFKVKADEMIDFEYALNEELGTPDVKKKEVEGRYLKTLEERGNSINSDLLRESRARKEAFQGINEYCEGNLVKIKDLLKKELADRDEFSEKFGNNLNARIQGTRSLIAAEKQSRELSEESLLKMLQELVARIKQEIDEEKRERQESEETLLGLLEETCSKLNNLTKF